MNRDPDPGPDDLEEYAGLIQFKQHGNGHFLSKSQRRQIIYAYFVRHRSARYIHREYFEGSTASPLCTLRRVYDIISEARKNPQRYVQGPSKRTGRQRGYLIRGSIEAEILLDLFIDGEYRCLQLLACDFRSF